MSSIRNKLFGTVKWYMIGAHVLSLTQCTGLPEVESLVSLFVSQCMYDVR